MPLTHQQKEEALAEITEHLDAVNTVYLTDYAGLTVAETNELRGAFREAGVDYKVLKNTLLRRAMEERGGYEDLLDKLTGPTAVAFTNDPAGPAKVLKNFLKEHETEIPSFKGAFIDGDIYDEGQLDALARLKSRDELLADTLALLLAPIKNIAGALDSQGNQLAGAIQAITDQAEA